MPTMRYIFGSLANGSIIAELALTSVSMEKKLNDYGTFRGTLRFDTSGVDNQDIVDATVPGNCFIIAERDDSPVWEGIVWTRVYDSQGKDLNITARSYEGYPERRLIDSDISFTGVEQRNIFISLWNSLQSSPNSYLAINVPSNFAAGINRDVSVKASEYKNYLQIMSGLANGVDGFDWTIDTYRQNDTYYRVLRIGTPLLGAKASGIGFDYPGNVTNYWKTDGMSNAATNLYVLGAGEGEDMITGQHEQSDLLNTGYRRYDMTYARKDISKQQQINSIAEQIGNQRRAPLSTLKVVVKGDVDPEFGSYALGDTVNVAIRDCRHPNGITSSARIVAFSYSPQSDDTIEQCELVFEGDDLNG